MSRFSPEANDAMLRLNRKQREVLLDKLPDVANLVTASRFLGQFLADRPFSLALAVFGIVSASARWLAVMVLANDMK
jgi:hypothetical protein